MYYPLNDYEPPHIPFPSYLREHAYPYDAKLSIKDEVGSASKIYYLQEPEYSDQSGDSYDPYVVVDVELTVYGLSTKFLYRASRDQTVTLKGANFDAGDDFSVRLTGTVA